MDFLKDLFDEKIIETINLFVENPGKKYYLSEVADATKVNITTTFRILNKLVSKGFLKATVIGKIRVYQLEKNEKTTMLLKFLKKETPLETFVEKLSTHPRLKGIILESKEKNSAKVLLVGDLLPEQKINQICEEIKDKENFKITFVEISEKQYSKLREFNYDLEKKAIWKKPQMPIKANQ